MASPQLLTDRFPADFSDQNRIFVAKTNAAIADGLQLERWSRDPDRKIHKFLLNLNRDYQLKNKAWGYFSDVKISGTTLTALGVLQEVEFGKLPALHAEERLKDYVLGLFLNTSNWTYEDGAQGGFTFKQMVYKTVDGTIGAWPDDRLSSVQDYRLMGTKYDWSLFVIYLHDFVVKLGPMKHALAEAVAVVQHPDFVHVVENPKPGYKLEVAIGYPFIDFAPVPNFFGFGPGKFNWAIKTFSFLLRDNNEVVCNMDFIAGARPKKVFDFYGLPDPVYGTAAALHTLSFGLFNPQPFHDWMDGQMCVQHSRVHQAVMEGSAKVFAAWVKDSGLAD
jgi:hypothetical protein